MRQLRYESGEAKIKPEGYQMLNQLVELLKASPPNQLIRVEGHADSMEIGPSLKSLYPTNWDLSKARATGVLRYLVEKGGIDSARISSIGYGATKPVMSNATEDGRSKNRRVEILLYSPDMPAPAEPAMAPADTADDGYRVSGLESGPQEPASPSINHTAEHTAVPTESNAAETSAVTPPVDPATLPEDSPSVSVPAETPAQP
jgi:chemotaxis protein MotB